MSTSQAEFSSSRDLFVLKLGLGFQKQLPHRASFPGLHTIYRDPAKHRECGRALAGSTLRDHLLQAIRGSLGLGRRADFLGPKGPKYLTMGYLGLPY